VPVTVKLSRKLYDKLGEDVANELVDWFNQVDATYRADLRELNELNYARFDAKLEQRLANPTPGGSAASRNWTRNGRAGWRILTPVGGSHRGAQDRTGDGPRRREERPQWMYAFWAPTALAVVGTGAGVISLLLRR